MGNLGPTIKIENGSLIDGFIQSDQNHAFSTSAWTVLLKLEAESKNLYLSTHSGNDIFSFNKWFHDRK